MTTYQLNLSSNSTNYNQVLSEIELEDNTLFTLNLEKLFNNVIPLFIKIDWGDGTVELKDNDVYGNRYDNQLSFYTYNPIFVEPHIHEYYPSTTSLYKLLTLQILVSYSDGKYSYFSVPIKINTKDIVETLDELSILNVNISKNELEYQLRTSTGVIEMIVPRN